MKPLMARAGTRRKHRWEWVHPSAARKRTLYSFAPAGLLSNAVAMEQSGCQVRIWIAPLQVALGAKEEARMLASLAEADGVGISLHWHEHAYGALSLARWVRAVNPGAAIVLGGITASAYAEEISVLAGDAVDAIVMGEAEEVAGEIARQVLSAGRAALPRFIPGSPPQGDRPCAAGYHLVQNGLEYARLDMHAYHPSRYTLSLWLKAGVGCPYGCAWCGGGKGALPAAFGDAFRLRGPRPLARDIGALAAAGIHEVCLTHDVSAGGREYWSELFRAVRRERYVPGVYLEAWQCPTSEFLTALADAFDPRFSRVVLSPTTGDEDHRRWLGKPFTNGELWTAVRTMDKVGLRYELYFARGLPGETPDTFDATSSLARRLAAEARPIEISIGEIVLDPFCPMQRSPDAYGLEVRLRTFGDYYERSRARSLGLPYERRGYQPVSDSGPIVTDDLGLPDLRANALLSASPFLALAGERP